SPGRQAFGEVLVADAEPLHHLAGLDLDLAQRRLPPLAGALVEVAVANQQALRERRRVVRERAHDFVPPGGRRIGAGHRLPGSRERQGQDGEAEREAGHRRHLASRGAVASRSGPASRSSSSVSRPVPGGMATLKADASIGTLASSWLTAAVSSTSTPA